MTKRMLIDAAHPEELRVAIANESKLEDFDYQSATRTQIKGNIYLAKVIRVEPSLQACFVEYGGNRHGFVAFTEIHPDYFRIPVEDRLALIAEEQSSQDDEELEEEKKPAAKAVDGPKAKTLTDDEAAEAVDELDNLVEETETNLPDAPEENPQAAGDDADEAEIDSKRRKPRAQLRKRYKIQEVIKKGQIMLVQTIKEERGNKCAAFTTYLSIPGRYCVLMPNTANAGGISRKINGGPERKKLREILDSLKVPEKMSIIVRTAGRSRTKQEIKRDYDYLERLWNKIRSDTMESVAPALIYTEGDIIQQSIRDLYDKDIEEVIVQGEEAHKAAKAIMKSFMPSHVKRVIEYNDAKIPLFHKYGIEDSLDQIFSSVVPLPSGGYIVIHPTEALISIDVNSGRSTKQRNIEETALKTNLEAAAEVARQLRLRDMAGLIVIDFIDMLHRRNIRTVENKTRDVFRTDRARVQVGRLSQFGLMEISRQRLKRSTFETTTEPCSHCQGSGFVRSSEFSSMRIIHGIQEQAIRGHCVELKVFAAPSVAEFITNERRQLIAALEETYSTKIRIISDTTLIAPNYRMERTELNTGQDEHGSDNSSRNDQRRNKDRGRNRRNRRNDRHNKSENKAGEDRPDNSAAKDQTDTTTDEKPTPKAKEKSGNARGKKQAETTQEKSEQKETPKESDKSSKTAAKPKASSKKKGAAKKSDAADVSFIDTSQDEPKKSGQAEEKTMPDNVRKIDGKADSPKKGWWSKLVN